MGSQVCSGGWAGFRFGGDMSTLPRLPQRAELQPITNAIIGQNWQYHSIDPETGLNEFSCGAAAEKHTAESIPVSPKYHFVRKGSGFVTVEIEGTVQNPRLVVAIHKQGGQVLHQEFFSREGLVRAAAPPA